MASGSECGSDVSSSSDVHELPGSGSGVQQPAARASGVHASSSSAVQEPAERGSGVQPPAAWDFSSSMDVDEAPGYISSVQQPARPASGGQASSSSAAAALVEEIGSFSPHPVRIEPGDVSFTHERKFPLALHLLVRIAGELYEATYAGHGNVKHVFLLHGKERKLHNTVLKLSLEPDIEPRMLIFWRQVTWHRSCTARAEKASTTRRAPISNIGTLGSVPGSFHSIKSSSIRYARSM